MFTVVYKVLPSIRAQAAPSCSPVSALATARRLPLPNSVGIGSSEYSRRISIDPASITASELGLELISSLWARAGELSRNTEDSDKTRAETVNLGMNPFYNLGKGLKLRGIEPFGAKCHHLTHH